MAVKRSNDNSPSRANVRKSDKKTAPKTKRAVKDRFLTIHIKEARNAFYALWHRPLGNLLTLAVISMALSMPACLYLLSKNVASAANNIATPSQITIYLEKQTPEARVMVLKDQLESNSLVKGVDYVSSQQGLEQLSKSAGFEQAISLLSDYSLPGVLIIAPNTSDKNKIKALAHSLVTETNVTDVRLDEDWLTRLDAIKKLASIVVVSLAILMFGAVFLIVGNTLRFNVLENKEAIQTMKMIGATDQYILRPYLYSGMWFGVIGAVIAWFFTALLTILLNGAVDSLAHLYDSQFRLLGLSWDESLLLLMIGTFLGSIAARVSAMRHLKEIEPV
jgi:cell division transport system permease protein